MNVIEITRTINKFLSLTYEERKKSNLTYHFNYEEIIIVYSFMEAAVNQDRYTQSVRGRSIRVEEEKIKLINIVYDELSKSITDRIKKLKKI